MKNIKINVELEENQGNNFIADVSNSTFNYDTIKEQTNGKVAIRKG